MRLISHRQRSQRVLWLLVSERETNGELSSRLFAFTPIGVSWSERRSLSCGNAPSITLAGECLPSCKQLDGALRDPFELNGGVILTNSLPLQRQAALAGERHRNLSIRRLLATLRKDIRGIPTLFPAASRCTAAFQESVKTRRSEE